MTTWLLFVISWNGVAFAPLPYVDRTQCEAAALEIESMPRIARARCIPGPK